MIAIRKIAGGICGLALYAGLWVETSADELTESRQSSLIAGTLQPQAARNLNSAAKSALRASAAAKTSDDRRAAARELLRVLIEVQSDQNLSTGDRHNLYHQVRQRLLAVEQGLRSEMNRERGGRNTASGGGSSDAGTSKHSAPRQVDGNAGQQVLAQQVGPAIPLNGVRPAPIVNARNPAGQPRNDDHGEELLELIQTVVRPSTWDRHGGPSSGVYYRSLHALVISAPSDVHSEVGAVLGGLRH